MSLASKFLSRKLSKSFPELSRPPVKEEAADEEGLSPPGGVMGRVESLAAAAAAYGQSWGTMLPKLLGEIIRRVEASADRWPQRQDVVACACVCKRWRDVTKEIVRASLNSEMITFPSCFKQPGPRDLSHQCLIIRNRKDSTFYLYLTPSFTDKGKFLLAARRYRRFAHYEYIISHDANDLSQGSNAYVGKLSSDFIGTNFTIYDSQPPHSGARPSSNWASRWFASKQMSPQVPASNFKVGHVTHRFNLKLRCPWRMVCSLKLPSCSGGEASPAPEKETNHLCEPNMKKSGLESASSCSGYTVLRNEAPWWIEHLQCWCLNFHGRVTWPSVQNFKIVATVDQSQGGGKGDKEETVLLQFGSVGVDVDTFTMDFRQPLSAFQAFAICLTTFGMKILTE